MVPPKMPCKKWDAVAAEPAQGGSKHGGEEKNYTRKKLKELVFTPLTPLDWQDVPPVVPVVDGRDGPLSAAIDGLSVAVNGRDGVVDGQDGPP